MKYLKLFEFNGDEKIDKDYIESVFSDFIDKGAVIEETDDPSEDDSVCQIIIPMPKLEFKYISNIDKLIEYSNSHENLLLDVKMNVGRVLDEYPNINVEYFLTNKQNYGEVLIIKFY